MRKLILVGVIVSMLAIMLMPALAGGMIISEGGTSPPSKTFYYSKSGLSILGSIYAYETPRQVRLSVYIYTAGIIRVLSEVELFFAPGPDQATTDVLCKSYYKEAIPAPNGWTCTVTLKQQDSSRPVFGRIYFGVATDAGAYANVQDVIFADNQAPTINYNEGLSTQLYSKIILPFDDAPINFYRR